MNSRRQFRSQSPRNETLSRRTSWKLSIIVIAVLLLALSACSKRSFETAASNPDAQMERAQANQTGARLTEADLKSKSPDKLATFVFENHGCKNCHTMGAGGRLGFTERGNEVGKNFEGCIRLLTAMNVIAQEKEENRTPEEKEKAARFEQFGCSTCHQITPGKLGLTDYGKKLASMHLACTDVERVLSRKKQGS